APRRAMPFSGRARSTSGRAVTAIAMVLPVSRSADAQPRFPYICFRGRRQMVSAVSPSRIAPMSLNFDLNFEPAHGEPVPIAPGVARVTARNPGPFTFHGTNSYLVGDNELAVIDPGPDNDEHLNALKGAIGGRPVSHILVSHTHRDHSPLAARLREATGAPVYAQGP